MATDSHILTQADYDRLAAVQAPPVSMTVTCIGWFFSILPGLMLIGSGVVKLIHPEGMDASFKELGYSPNLALFLGCLELASVVIYLIPRTAVLGAILVTGYLGGAVATHVRINDPFLAPVLVGVFIWFGLYLRDPRLRALMPLRRPADAAAPAGGVLRVLGNIVLILVVVVLIIAGLAAVQPAEFRITRTTTMNAQPSAVFAHVNDFHKWDAWSPWAKLDPAAKNTFDGPPAGTGAIFKWSGNDKVGEGMMTIKDSKPGELVRIKLEFTRPFEDIADTEFTFKKEGEQTVVTWTMASERNFLAKTIGLFMNMEKMVGGEFDKGLKSMKSVVEAENQK